MLKWVDEYIQHRRAEGIADATALTLKQKFRLFGIWAKRHVRSDVRRITPAKFRAFVAWAANTYRVPRGPNRGKPIGRLYLRDIVLTIKHFLRWLVDRRRLITNPSNSFENLDPPKVLPRGILTFDEVKRLLKQPDVRTPNGARDAAVLEVLYGAGLRKGELYNLDMNDADLTRGTVFIRNPKNRRDRVVPIGRRATAALDRYLTHARIRLVASPVESALFVSDWGVRFRNGAINRMLSKYARRAKIKSKFTAHGIRHTCATHMLEAGSDLKSIQLLLGHADLWSTQIYTQVVEKHLRDVHRRTHPRGRKRRPSR